MSITRPSKSLDLATVRALRVDLALQIARHIRGLGLSQSAAARTLSIPQPTLSKIFHSQVADLSLELMLRIAARAQLQLVLLTGKDPAEAGVFVSGKAVPLRAQKSRLANLARRDLSIRAQQTSPEQRLDAQLQHSQLLAELRRSAKNKPDPRRADGTPKRKRIATTRGKTVTP